GRDLRGIRYGGLEIAQRVYIAIRDRNWDTVPGAIRDLSIDQREEQFAVRFTVTHRRAEVDLAWQGEILGEPDGTISYVMDCTVNADLDYKLIGLNIHHGMRQYVGRPYEGDSPAGPVSGVFTQHVFPQLVVDETEVPIFPDVSRLTTHLTDDVAVTFTFDGDTFEFEDQRNWTDGSFKSQSYPPRRGGLSHASAGQHLFQSVTIRAAGPVPAAKASASTITVTLGEPTGTRLPPLGLGMASHGSDLSPREADLLRALHPAHLRANLHLGTPNATAELERAIRAARVLETSLELALFVTDHAAAELAEIAPSLANLPAPVSRVLVFHEQEQATLPRWLEMAHASLDGVLPGAAFAGGSNANFCELNRHQPDRPDGDAISFGITPQIHAFDERSMAENLAPQAEAVRSARAFSGAPVVVSPVTLRPRFNAVAQSDVAAVAGELPYAVDARQMSLFGAGWTLGSVKYLAEAHPASVTYYETTGWQGVLETQAGSPEPDLFPSRLGEVFPLYHVLADLAELRDAELVQVASSNPFAVEALALRDATGTHLLLANLTPEPREVVLALPGGSPAQIRRLNETSAASAMATPEDFRHSSAPCNSETVTMMPFEVMRIDASA
ncbi:MAG: hypothetical protein M3Z20_01745, partial [Chloroflexota bacterium]|nr:hypothetical protein [Chloroflexota bacterium]